MFKFECSNFQIFKFSNLNFKNLNFQIFKFVTIIVCIIVRILYVSSCSSLFITAFSTYDILKVWNWEENKY